MRIAINTRLLIPGHLDGIGWFTAETVRRMVTEHPEHEFILFFDRQVTLDWKVENMRQVVLMPPARHPVLWYLFFEWSVTCALRKYKPDVFLSTDGWMSLKTKVPTLTVIHDLNFEHATDYLRPSHQRYMKHFFPLFARKATHVATVSEFSKEDIAQQYGVAREKIDVVYDGSHNNYQPCDETTKQRVREQQCGGNPYYIFIGTISKRKNLANILLAFDRFKTDDKQSTQLLVVGNRYWWGDELKEAYDSMQHQSDVHFIGRAEPAELAQLLSASVALVYPSLFEGFGIPILEAYFAETAVITSNITSMPEVAGEAALLVDPYNVEEIAEAMKRLSLSEELRNSLIEKGRVQRTLFDWDRTTRLLWQSLMKTYEERQ